MPSRGDPTDQIQDAFSVAFGAVEALHASGEIERRSGVRLERSLHTLLFLVGRHGPVRISELTRGTGLWTTRPSAARWRSWSNVASWIGWSTRTTGGRRR